MIICILTPSPSPCQWSYWEGLCRLVVEMRLFGYSPFCLPFLCFEMTCSLFVHHLYKSVVRSITIKLQILFKFYRQSKSLLLFLFCTRPFSAANDSISHLVVEMHLFPIVLAFLVLEMTNWLSIHLFKIVVMGITDFTISSL